MTSRPRWPAWTIVTGTGAASALAGFALYRYPRSLDDPAAPLFVAGLCAMLALYLGIAAWGVRRPGTGQAVGVVVGLAGAGAWSAEIWAGGPAMLDRPVEKAVGGTFALLAVVVTVAAGVIVGSRERDAAAARAGLFAGLGSGAAVFCFAVVMTLTNLGVLATLADYRRQFATGHSHAPDMATFLVGDILAAGVAHLVINLVLGLIGGGLGRLGAKALGRRAPSPAIPQPGQP